jgi:hypothetical protein
MVRPSGHLEVKDVMRPRFKHLPALVLLGGVLAGLLWSKPAHAQFNNYPDIKWYDYETEHFVIHYYPEEEWTARRVAKYAELMYPKITGYFGYPLKEKVHFLIRDQEDISNGFAVYEYDWVTIWAEGLYYRLRGRQDWIPDVITHEFSHIVSLKANSFQAEAAIVIYLQALREDGVHDIDVGGSLLMGFGYAPFWWTEGGAEYWTHLSGYNWWTTSRDMLLRMAILEGNELDSSEWATRDNREGFGGELGYNQGYSAGLYVLETYGKEKYADMALNSSNSGHLNWDDNVEDVLGITAAELHDNWRKWVKAKYEKMVEPILKDEAKGTFPLSLTAPKKSWDDLMKLPKSEKRRTLHAGGLFSTHPRFSPDGKWLSLGGVGVMTVKPISYDKLPEFTGKYLTDEEAGIIESGSHTIVGVPFAGEEYGWSPDSKKIVVASQSCLDAWSGCTHVDSYSVNDLYVYDLDTEKATRISSHLRAINPAWSPDGKDIAFIRNVDGQQHLGLIKPDGTDIRWLVARYDGTQIDVINWSPDGKQIVMALYRNGQQDIWIINRDGTGLRPLTWDKAEDKDPAYSMDGKSIYFSSDMTGVFNVYKMDLETGELTQLTNVVSGAFTPWETPDGNILYTHFTSFGFKYAAMKKAEFYNKRVENTYGITDELVAEALATEEDLPEIKDRSEPYHWWKNLQPPVFVPILLYERGGFTGGLQVIMGDYAGTNRVGAVALVGSNQIFQAVYVNDMWYPTFYIGALLVNINASDNFAVDFDGDPAARPELVLSLKRRFRYDIEFAGASWGPTDALSFTIFAQRLHFTLQNAGTGSKPFPLWNRFGVGASVVYSAYGRGDGGINPRGGRYFEFSWNYFQLNTLFQGGGLNYDGIEDTPVGERFHEFSLTYTERIPVPWFRKYVHSLDLSFVGGYQTKNVGFANFFAGNVSPLRFIPNATANTAFAGYEGFSIIGETMVIFNAAYRFPIVRRMDKKVGAFYFDSLYAQVFTTAGNIWGFTCDYPRNEHGDVLTYANAADYGYSGVVPDGRLAHFSNDPYCPPGRARREIPFIDVAQQNGNYLLYDVGFDLMLKANIFNYLPWNSFIRVAYGLNDMRGRNDVNGDNIFNDVFPNDPLVSEEETKRFRISIGIGGAFF